MLFYLWKIDMNLQDAEVAEEEDADDKNVEVADDKNAELLRLLIWQNKQ